MVSLNLNILQKLKVLIFSFSYTVKLVIDSFTIVPCENDDDLFEAIKSYESDWFIGYEKEPEYVTSIQKGQQYIFTLFDDRDKVFHFLNLIKILFKLFYLIENCK